MTETSSVSRFYENYDVSGHFRSRRRSQKREKTGWEFPADFPVCGCLTAGTGIAKNTGIPAKTGPGPGSRSGTTWCTLTLGKYMLHTKMFLAYISMIHRLYLLWVSYITFSQGFTCLHSLKTCLFCQLRKWSNAQNFSDALASLLLMIVFLTHSLTDRN